MACLVIDPSVALAWVLTDETSAQASAVRQAIESGAEAWIPTRWWLEVSNGLLMAERRKRLRAEEVERALGLLEGLPFEQDDETAEHLSARTLSLARKHGLTIYDAAYLELAQRRGATLASFDAQLMKAATKQGVPLLVARPSRP